MALSMHTRLKTEVEDIFSFQRRIFSSNHCPKGNGRLSLLDDADDRRSESGGLIDSVEEFATVPVNLAMEDLIKDRTRRTLRFGVRLSSPLVE